jgi:hypothetical protein
LALGCPLLKWFQQLEQATPLGLHGSHQACPTGHLLKGTLPPLVRDRATYGSIGIVSVSFIRGPLVGRFEAATNGFDGDDEPIALLRWAFCVLEYL